MRCRGRKEGRVVRLGEAKGGMREARLSRPVINLSSPTPLTNQEGSYFIKEFYPNHSSLRSPFLYFIPHYVYAHFPFPSFPVSYFLCGILARVATADQEIDQHASSQASLLINYKLCTVLFVKYLHTYITLCIRLSVCLVLPVVWPFLPASFRNVMN